MCTVVDLAVTNGRGGSRRIRLILVLCLAVVATWPQLFAAGAASAQPSVQGVLYDQMDDFSGVALVSENRPLPGRIYTASGADDFIVPAGETWTVKGVSVKGNWITLIRERVRFFTDAGGKPGDVIASFPHLRGNQLGRGVVRMWLGAAGPVLHSGTYWVAVQSDNHDENPLKGFYWNLRTRYTNSVGMWQNPGDGWGAGCTAWAPVSDCYFPPPSDFMFALAGEKS